MGYIQIINRIIKDNGLLNGGIMFFILSCQKFIGYPKKYTYQYNSIKINKTVKMKYSSDISRGFALFEIFGFCPYYSSKSGRIKFNININSKVCDIGAFIGDSAVFFGLQGAKVYSYEPQIMAFRLMQDNIKLNKLNNVTILNYPVTFDGRTLSLDNNANKISDSFNIKDNSGLNKTNSIKFTEALKVEKIWDLVKIDIEGGEWEILEDLCRKPITLNKIRGIAMEIHKPKENKQILSNFVQILQKNKFLVEVDVQNELGMLWAKKED